MINRVVLIGRITRDVEIRYTQSGLAVASFNLAVNRQFKSANGEREADFISCQIWRKGAENLANYTHKGSLIGIDGRVQTRNYEKDGAKIYVTEVVVDNFSLLESRSVDNEEQESKPTQQNQNTFQQNKEIDLSADDLPF